MFPSSSSVSNPLDDLGFQLAQRSSAEALGEKVGVRELQGQVLGARTAE